MNDGFNCYLVLKCRQPYQKQPLCNCWAKSDDPANRGYCLYYDDDFGTCDNEELIQKWIEIAKKTGKLF